MTDLDQSKDVLISHHNNSISSTNQQSNITDISERLQKH